mmetsp:Transcript_29485/g.77572  ORF Transcript_29485/g.77572 Transcript_29485/m.77572 type:complete len:214 (-) Transcript_29485:9-650(-)
MCVVLGGVSAGLLILTAPRPGSSNHRDGGDDVNSINEYTYGRFRKRGRESLNSLKRSQFSPTLSQKDEHESGAQARTRPCDYLVETFARHAISVNCHQGMNKREQAVQDATEGCSGGINKEEQPKKEGRRGGRLQPLERPPSIRPSIRGEAMALSVCLRARVPARVPARRAGGRLAGSERQRLARAEHRAPSNSHLGLPQSPRGIDARRHRHQ